MKILFNEADKLYTIIAVAALIFLSLNVFQFIANGRLNDDIAVRESINVIQLHDIEALELSIKLLEKEKEVLIKRADSFQSAEVIYKNKYYATNKKLKAIISSYIVSTDDAKWDAFTDSLNE